MRIVMAGASGFLGTRLRAHLADSGHEIVQLVRRPAEHAGEHRWAPEQGELDSFVLEDTAAVINLAGVGIGDARWSPAHKGALRSSRVESTRTLARVIADLPAPSRPTLLNASAVGFYGDTGDHAVDETGAPGTGFLSDLCLAWEAATAAADQADVRVVRFRTGYPLDTAGGLLKPMLLPFRLGIGGKLAGGRQWMPWISMADWLGAISFLLQRADIVGPVNIVGPQPVRNAEFTRVLAELMHRPAVAPIPRIALRVLLGEFGNEIVASQRVLPGVLDRAGYRFQHTDLASALRAAGV